MQDFKTRRLLKSNFNFTGGYWYPLTNDMVVENCEYFDEDRFLSDYGLQRLVILLGSLGCAEVNEISESLEDRVIPIQDLEPYLGIETIYCDEKVEWAIYFSHENTVTFFGDNLLNTLKNDWPTWTLYRDPWKLKNIA